MTISVRFYLSYDSLKWDFIAFKMNIISKRKHIVDIDVVNDVKCKCQSVITCVWSFDFYDTMLSTEKQRHHMI